MIDSRGSATGRIGWCENRCWSAGGFIFMRKISVLRRKAWTGSTREALFTCGSGAWDFLPPSASGPRVGDFEVVLERHFVIFD